MIITDIVSKIMSKNILNKLTNFRLAIKSFVTQMSLLLTRFAIIDIMNINDDYEY